MSLANYSTVCLLKDHPPVHKFSSPNNDHLRTTKYFSDDLFIKLLQNDTEERIFSVYSFNSQHSRLGVCQEITTPRFLPVSSPQEKGSWGSIALQPAQQSLH